MWEMKCCQYKARRRARFCKSDNEADVYRNLAINFNSLRKQRIVWVELEKVFKGFRLPADIMGIIWHHLSHDNHKFKSWCHSMVQSHELQQANQQPWNYKANKKRWEARCRWLECSGYLLTLASLQKIEGDNINSFHLIKNGYVCKISISSINICIIKRIRNASLYKYEGQLSAKNLMDRWIGGKQTLDIHSRYRTSWLPWRVGV